MTRALATLAVSLVLVVSATGNAPAQGMVPQGSYRQSCVNARMQGGMLFATCINNRGMRVGSSINPRACNGADIGNINGRLSCVRRGNYYGSGSGHFGNAPFGGRFTSNRIPTGTYLNSCSNPRMNGSTLIAACRSNNGRFMTSFLDISRCNRDDDIGNVNGQLRCIFRP